MTGAERVRAELEILGLDVSHHVVDFYAPMLHELGVVWARDLLRQRSRSELLVAGVKVATQTPPIRSGRRVVFLTLDDGTGPVDATFFEDAQGPYAATLFHSWLLVVRGELRRTGPKGVSLRATGCWELPELHGIWQRGGIAAVLRRDADDPCRLRRRQWRAGAPRRGREQVDPTGDGAAAELRDRSRREGADGPTAGGMGRRRCSSTRAGSSSRRTPTSNPQAKPPSPCRGSYGTAPRQLRMSARLARALAAFSSLAGRPVPAALLRLAIARPRRRSLWLARWSARTCRDRLA